MKFTKNTARIVVPILIVVIIAGMWWFSTADDRASAPTGEDLSAQLPSDTNEEVGSGEDVEALPLSVESVDVDALKSLQLPIILDFGSDDCIPCQEMAPVLESLHAKTQGEAVIHFLDVWAHPNAADGFPVQVIPTQILFNADGTPFVPSDELMASIPGFTMYAKQGSDEPVFTAHQGGLTEEQMAAILAEMGVSV